MTETSAAHHLNDGSLHKKNIPQLHTEPIGFGRLNCSLNSCSLAPFRTVDGVRYFSPMGRELPTDPIPETLRILVITSLRDIGCSDKAGQFIEIDGSRKYFKGSLESLVESTLDPKRLMPFARIVSVVVDDVPWLDKVEKNGYDLLPTANRKKDGSLNWIAPADLAVDSKNTLRDVTVSIPSDFRKIPVADQSRRILEKARFEEKVLNHARETGANLILSDHCILKFESVHKDPEFSGMVINIHPGITWAADPNNVRGLTPTRDMLIRAREKSYCRAGASLHLVSNEIDGGEVICDAERTIINPFSDCEMSLKFRNYTCSKIPVLENGLRHFARHHKTIRTELNLL